MNILVTGAAGFVGNHLIDELENNGHNAVAAINNNEKLSKGVTTYLANLSIKERDSETKFLEVMSKIRNSDVENEIRLAEIDAEQTRTQVDAAINISNHINSLTKGDKHD